MSAAQKGCFNMGRGGGGSCFKPRSAIERVPLLRQNSAAGLDARLALMEKTNTQGVGNVAAEYRSFEDDEGGDGTTTTTSEATTPGRDVTAITGREQRRDDEKARGTRQVIRVVDDDDDDDDNDCLLYTSPSPRDATLSRMPSSA